jgi:hypothetical protein
MVDKINDGDPADPEATTFVWRIAAGAHALGISFTLTGQSIFGDSAAVHGTR